MGRLIAAAILLVITLGICITGSIYINDACVNAQELCKECQTAYSNRDSAETVQKATELKGYIEKNSLIFAAFVNHADTDELISLSAELSTASQTQSQEFPLILSRISSILKNIRSQQKISAESFI